MVGRPWAGRWGPSDPDAVVLALESHRGAAWWPSTLARHARATFRELVPSQATREHQRLGQLDAAAFGAAVCPQGGSGGHGTPSPCSVGACEQGPSLG